MNISKELLKLKEKIIMYRRELHMIPEVGFEEYKTSKYIKSKLDSFGIEYVESAKTGVVGFINKNEKAKTIAVRSDMDALTMEELTGLDFKSSHPGFMHGCGHDGHMAMLLGLANYLSKNIDSLLYNVVFIFQPAEEGPGGAEIMVAEGILKKFKVDEIYGFHLYPEVPEGKIAIMAGPVMAMTGEMDVVIKGMGGHGAMPHKSNDAIIIGCEFINQIQSIVSRNINPNNPAVLTFGCMVAGERRNIIAKEVRLEGTMRAFDKDVYNLMKYRMIEIAKGMEIGYNCNINLEIRDMYPPVCNDKKLVDRIIENDTEQVFIQIEPQMTSEDFSYFQQEIPGVFMFLGTKNEEDNHIYPLHNSQYSFNEIVLLYGVQTYINLLTK